MRCVARAALFPLVLAAACATGGTYDGDLRYDAIVTRDAFGVPHIQGRTSADVAYALGQTQCEDRLSDVVRNLLTAGGRLAEVAGEPFLDADREARHFGHRAASVRDWPALPTAVRSVVEAFVRGINDWLAEHPKAQPRPVAPFEPADVVAWHRMLMLAPELAVARADADALPESGPRAAAVAPGRSNAWAVAGARSVTGKPVLLLDPHGPLEGPLRLYEAHLRGGDLDVWGFMAVGTPLPAVGATPGVAWAFTAGGGDSADAFLLRLNPADPDEYEWEGKFARMELRRETFKVRDGAVTRLVEDRFRLTRHGPVVRNARGDAVALALDGAGHARALEQVWRMNTARTSAELKAALALDRISFQNVVWAAADGRIGYLQAGQVPDRAAGYDWQTPVPGWMALTLWRGLVPHDRLPRIEDPQAGFLQNCNSPAGAVAPGVTFDRAQFPPGVLYAHVGEYRARGRRALDLLERTPTMTPEAARAVAFDTYSLPADPWIPILLSALREAGEPDDLKEASALLSAWDRRADVDSAGATLFRFWRLACHRREGSPLGRDTVAVSDTEEIRRGALAALREAVAELRRRFGRVAVPWGEIKRLRRGDREWGVGGDGLGALGLDTLRAAGGDVLGPDHRFRVTHGQNAVGVVFLGERPTVYAIQATGQSEDPASPHYADQAPLFASQQFRRVPWMAPEILAEAKSERAVAGPRR